MSSDAPEADEFFDLETPLGRDYAAVDWAATPLGPPSDWPNSLRATFRLMFRSRFAMWMAWGEQLTFFCNDAYRRDTLGTKYPWALGRPTAQVWSEIWADILPLIDSVMREGKASFFDGLLLFLERSGYSEETYHTFSYSPLLGDDAEIAGLFCVVSEDTGRVISERRIAALRDLGVGLAAAHTEGDVLAAVTKQVAADPHDLPFVVGYLASGAEADLAFASGVDPGHAIAPYRLDPADPESLWSVNWPIDGETRVVDDLRTHFADLPTGAWSQPPIQALTVALIQPGDLAPAGFLAVGLNPHRPLDPDYTAFVELVAGQLAAALTRARAFEAERLRAEQMAELDRSKTTFFTNVSHELRTPLTLLLGPAEDALADVAHPLSPVHRGRFEVVHRNGERLLKLVNTLLDFSRLESGRMQARFEPVELAQLTAELASMFDSAASRVGLQLDVQCPPLPTPIHVDREMWAKIVLNLVSNALKATFTGGVTVRVGGTAQGASLSVTDTGVGIPRAEQDQLFERFHRVAGARLRTHEGSGIGLALVAELAELHGGEVSVSSAPGEGSTFTVTVRAGTEHLPQDQLVDDPSPEGVSVARYGAGYLAEAMRWLVGEEPVVASPVADESAHRVLVVDDNTDMRGYISGLLGAEYRVQTASDGAMALELARADPPDLVLTDVMMPVLDGFGLLAELRVDPRTMHIPVVMLSARSGEDAAVEGLEAGADDYLVKPFSQRELMARVRANLELDRVRRLADELEHSRSLLAHAEEMAQVGSFDYDIATDRFDATPQYYTLLGASVDDLSVGAFAASAALVHEDDRDRVTAAATRSFTTGASLDTEFRVGHRVIWMRANVDLHPDGTPCRVRGSAQDVTAQRAAERAERAAAASEVVAARESAIARELQQSLLPADTFDADHLDIAGYYQPGVEGTQVGGDWYDVIALDAGRTALVLGDVMGRGVQAAAIMGQLRATVRAYSRLELAPDTVLHLLDDAVRDISDHMIVTCVYAIYDPTEQTLTYANAGHLPPLLVRPGEPAARLSAGGPPLGAGRAWGSPATLQLPTGALLAMFTDGLVERRGEDLDDAITRVATLLETAQGDVAELPGRLIEAMISDDHDDDVALLIARVSDRSSADRFTSRFFDSDVSLVSDSREYVSDALLSWGVPEGLTDDARLIVSELVTNAMVHGRPPVELRVRLGGGRVLLEVLDSAVTTPQLQHAKPTDDHGRGLLIVSMLAERWGTRPTPKGKSVWCQLRLP